MIGTGHPPPSFDSLDKEFQGPEVVETDGKGMDKLTRETGHQACLLSCKMGMMMGEFHTGTVKVK